MTQRRKKFEPHIIRYVSRKLKKALKNYPCRKTRLGRYIIDVFDSHYDDDYEHPSGDFFHHLIYDENALWTFDDRVADMIYKKYGLNDDTEFNEDIFFDI